MDRPNIFRYANRELSQDAMICWLLACLHSSDPEYRTLGLNFLRLIFGDVTIQENEVILEPESPHKQYYHMDVYAVVCVRNKLYPIIFENKTNTYLHSGQFLNYCSEVAMWMSPKDSYYQNLLNSMNVSPDGWGEIVYVYFKTGYSFGWQKRDFCKQKETVKMKLAEAHTKLMVKEIYLDTIVDFLACQKRDFLLNDYYEVLKKQKDNRDYVFAHGLESVESCYAALDDQEGSNEAGCAILFQNIFGEDSYFNYNHQHWASRDLFTTMDENGNQTYYCFRFQWCKYQKAQGAYAFQLQQWRSEKSVRGSSDQALQNKIDEAGRIKTICEKMVSSRELDDIEMRFEKLKEYPCKSYDGQMIMKVFITNASEPQKVCDFLRSFSEQLRKEVKEQFGEATRLLNYTD